MLADPSWTAQTIRNHAHDDDSFLYDPAGELVYEHQSFTEVMRGPNWLFCSSTP